MIARRSRLGKSTRDWFINDILRWQHQNGPHADALLIKRRHRSECNMERHRHCALKW